MELSVRECFSQSFLTKHEESILTKLQQNKDTVDELSYGEQIIIFEGVVKRIMNRLLKESNEQNIHCLKECAELTSFWHDVCLPKLLISAESYSSENLDELNKSCSQFLSANAKGLQHHYACVQEVSRELTDAFADLFSREDLMLEFISVEVYGSSGNSLCLLGTCDLISVVKY